MYAAVKDVFVRSRNQAMPATVRIVSIYPHYCLATFDWKFRLSIARNFTSICNPKKLLQLIQSGQRVVSAKEVPYILKNGGGGRQF